MEIEILFQNDEYTVCKKPSGVMSEDGNAKGMPSLLNENNPLLTVHRLDREVGGVTVYAKKSKSAANLMKQIQNGEFLKEYYAVVEGEVEPFGRYEDLLFKDSSKNKSFVVKRERKGVKKAILNYELVKTISVDDSKLSLVKVKLETGRTHQIRVQFSSRNHPVFGDKKYGSKCTDGFGLYLKKIVFKCPKTNEYKEYTLSFPDSLPWKLF